MAAEGEPRGGIVVESTIDLIHVVDIENLLIPVLAEFPFEDVFGDVITVVTMSIGAPPVVSGFEEE